MKNKSTEKTFTTPSKILVIGATGGTGRLIVSQALAAGHHVTALVRSAEKGRDLTGAKLIIGDARDENILRDAVRGKDIIISALGTPVSPFRAVNLLSTATQLLVDAMKAEGVSRLICITGIGAGDSAGHGGFLFDKLIYPLLLRKVYDDKNRQEHIIRDSSLNWVLIRPTILNDKPGRETVRALTDLSSFRGETISRVNVAKFALEQMHDDEWLHRSPLISW